MRWNIIAVLWHKEALRHLAQPGGIILAILLVAASVLLSFFGQSEQPTANLVGEPQKCYIDYWQDGPWIDHLRQHVPAELKGQILFRDVKEVQIAHARIVYPQGSGAIQIRVDGKDDQGQPRYKVWVWEPSGGLAPFEAWFWKESDQFHQGPSAASVDRSPLDNGGFNTRTALSTALVLFALFFVCVYLLPSLTCEERERGVLLAQALSPASPVEILIAKMLFYPVIGVALAAVLAGIACPAALLTRFFWLALIVSAVGSLGIGLTLASLARSQRAASMGAMTYTLAIGLVLFICKQNNIPLLPNVFLEYYSPRMINAALTQSVYWYHWANLIAAAVLAVGWNVLAVVLFRRCGWQ